MTDAAAVPPQKRENLFLNIVLNVGVPSIVLMKGKPWLGLDDPRVVLVLALAFPLCYGVYDYLFRGKKNFFSVIGIVSTLISGGVGLLELDKDLIAIKEAAIPGLFAIAVIVSLWTPFPLVRTFLFTPELFDVKKIHAALVERETVKPFDRLMVVLTLYLAGSFVISSILNYVLAKYFIRSETGTDEFAAELGKMTLWSYPIILVPSTIVLIVALWQLIKGIQKLTGYEIEDVLLVGTTNEHESTRIEEAGSDGDAVTQGAAGLDGDAVTQGAAGSDGDAVTQEVAGSDGDAVTQEVAGSDRDATKGKEDAGSDRDKATRIELDRSDGDAGSDEGGD